MKIYRYNPDTEEKGPLLKEGTYEYNCALGAIIGHLAHKARSGSLEEKETCMIRTRQGDYFVDDCLDVIRVVNAKYGVSEDDYDPDNWVSKANLLCYHLQDAIERTEQEELIRYITVPVEFLKTIKEVLEEAITLID